MAVYIRKMVRDKVPEIMKASGKPVNEVNREPARRDPRDANRRRLYLALKALEECQELYGALDAYDDADSKVIEELADVEEVLATIKQEWGISQPAVDLVRKLKRDLKGPFEEGVILEFSDDEMPRTELRSVPFVEIEKVLVDDNEGPVAQG